MGPPWTEWWVQMLQCTESSKNPKKVLQKLTSVCLFFRNERPPIAWPWRGQRNKENFQKSSILEFEVIVQPLHYFSIFRALGFGYIQTPFTFNILGQKYFELSIWQFNYWINSYAIGLLSFIHFSGLYTLIVSPF